MTPCAALYTLLFVVVILAHATWMPPAPTLKIESPPSRLHPMKRIKNPQQPKVRSSVARAAWTATGAGKHGGSSREQLRRDRQNTKRALRAGSEV